MKNLNILMYGALSVLLVASCKQADRKTSMIPADAGFVLHINTSSLSSKLSWNEIRQTSWFSEMYDKSADSLSKSLLTDPDKAGIDTKADLFVFYKKQGNNGYVAFEGTVKDAAAFESFNKSISAQAATVKDGDYNSINIKDKSVVTWSNNRFVYVVDAPAESNKYMMREEEDGVRKGFPVDSLKKIGKDLFELPGDRALSDNDKFTSLLKETGDVHLWMNSGALYGGLGSNMMSMMKLNVLFEGNTSAMTLNFDNGKIAFKSKSYYNKEMSNLIDKYPAKPIGEDVINRIPSKDVVAAIVFNYPPEGLKEFLKLIGVDGMVNGFLGNAGYSIDEFVKANKGDMVFAVSDLKVNTTSTSDANGDEPQVNMHAKPDFNYLFAVSINDKAAFDKLVATVQKQVPDEMSQSFKLNYQLNDKWFAAGNNTDYVTKFNAGTSGKQPFADKIAGHPFGVYVDIHRLMNASQPAISDSSANEVLNASLRFWQDAVFYGGEVKNGSLTSEGEINLVDKNTNSLKQINQYADTLAKIHKSKREVDF